MNTLITSQAEFEGLQLTIIHKDGQRWLTAEQAGKALGMKHPRIAVWKIFDRNRDEFEDGVDVSVTKLVTEHGERETLIFSPTGCMLLGMFARTSRAKAFRRWAKHLLAEAAADPQKTREALLRARPLWREILRLKQMRGPLGEYLSNAEIARALGMHRDTLRKHLRRMEDLGLIAPPPDYERRRAALRHLPLFRNAESLH